ncbi:MAG: hypothetical protein Q9202_004218 [Teloschistes flavicans]
MRHSTLRPYNDDDYSYILNCMRELISKYQHCRDSATPCGQCLSDFLGHIAIAISELMKYAPSKEPVDEYAHLSQLTLMSKDLLGIDAKAVCKDIWALIDRKSAHLETTHLAKPPAKVPYTTNDLQPRRRANDDDGDNFNSMESEDDEAPIIKMTFQPRRRMQPLTLVSDGRVNEGNVAVLRDAINAPSAADQNLPGTSPTTSSVLEPTTENQQPRQPSSSSAANAMPRLPRRAQTSVFQGLISNYGIIDGRTSATTSFNTLARSSSPSHDSFILSRPSSPPLPATPRPPTAVADFSVVERAPPTFQPDPPMNSEGQRAGMFDEVHELDDTKHVYLTAEEQWIAAGRPATVSVPMGGPNPTREASSSKEL